MLHISEIIWHLLFFDWLISLSIIPSRPIMLLQMVRFHSFLWLSNIASHICTTAFKKIIWLKNILFIYFLDRREGKEKERGRKINVWLPQMSLPPGSWPTARHVPWVEIKLATFWFAGPCSIHWATSARAVPQLFYPLVYWWALGLLPYLGDYK